MPRVAAKIVIHEGNAFATEKFTPKYYLGDPINVASIFSAFTCDEIILVNISEEIPWHTLKAIAWGAHVPLTYGGGVHKIDEVKEIISLGYEKILLRESLVPTNLSKEIVNRYGKQSLACSLIMDESYKEIDKRISNLEEYCGEIYITRKQLDGARLSDEEIISVSGITDLPLILTCGIGSSRSVQNAFRAGYDGVALGTEFSLLQNNFSLAHIEQDYLSLMECNK
jgi:cyclase